MRGSKMSQNPFYFDEDNSKEVYAEKPIRDLISPNEYLTPIIHKLS